MTEYHRDHFRAELLLQLPDDFVIGPNYSNALAASALDPDPVPEYDRDALAEWILGQVDSALEATIPESEIGRVATLAGAAGTLKASVEFASYLDQLAAILKRGHTLASQNDLARTIGVESLRLKQLAAELVNNVPGLIPTSQPEVSLVLPGQNG